MKLKVNQIILIELDKIVGVCKDFQLFVDKPEFIIKTENGVPYCFVEENVGKQIGFFK